ncbi:MAG: hypothetical protein Q9M44_04120 [Ghiorsea sp.]|nr:hypothetical protein [Ghiorsea sp.]
MQEKWAIRITAGFFIAVILYIFFPISDPNPRPTFWDIQPSAQSTSILGLTINQYTLRDVMATLQTTPDIALFTTRQRKNEPEPDMHLEAFFDDLYDHGDRIIIGLSASTDLLQHIKKEAYKPQIFPNNTVRISIQEKLIPDVLQLPIHNITIIASSPIMFEDFKEAFGEPDKFINDGQGNAHFLYPALGLDFIQPANGAQVLQFVDPSRFEQELLNPLIQSLPKGAIQ